MNETIKLQKDLEALYRKIIGNELTAVSVMRGTGWITYVKSKPAANTIADLMRDIPLLKTVKIEETREEIDILDKNGDLIDIEFGKIEGYLVTGLFK